MLLYLIILIEIIGGYLVADFLSGLFHWSRDTYCTPHTPIIGFSLIWPSRLHHIKPRYIIEQSDLSLCISSGLWTCIWWIPLVLMYQITWFLTALFVFITLNDVVHKYAHTTRAETPKYIIVLQNIGLLQTHKEHHLHHTEPFETHYCPMTPYVNPILERMGFWRRLENLIEGIFGLKPRAQIDLWVLDESESESSAGVKFVQF